MNTHLDTQLLEQYFAVLGAEGLQASLDSFKRFMPNYLSELEAIIALRDSAATRLQAHKMKGACRSLGFAHLAKTMEFIEKSAWLWPDLEVKLAPWLVEMKADIEAAFAWLAGYEQEKK